MTAALRARRWIAIGAIALGTAHAAPGLSGTLAESITTGEPISSASSASADGTPDVRHLLARQRALRPASSIRKTVAAGRPRVAAQSGARADDAGHAVSQAHLARARPAGSVFARSATDTPGRITGIARLPGLATGARRLPGRATTTD